MRKTIPLTAEKARTKATKWKREQLYNKGLAEEELPFDPVGTENVKKEKKAFKKTKKYEQKADSRATNSIKRSNARLKLLNCPCPCGNEITPTVTDELKAGLRSKLWGTAENAQRKAVEFNNKQKTHQKQADIIKRLLEKKETQGREELKRSKRQHEQKAKEAGKTADKYNQKLIEKRSALQAYLEERKKFLKYQCKNCGLTPSNKPPSIKPKAIEKKS